MTCSECGGLIGKKDTCKHCGGTGAEPLAVAAIVTDGVNVAMTLKPCCYCHRLPEVHEPTIECDKFFEAREALRVAQEKRRAKMQAIVDAMKLRTLAHLIEMTECGLHSRLRQEIDMAMEATLNQETREGEAANETQKI